MKIRSALNIIICLIFIVSCDSKNQNDINYLNIDDNKKENEKFCDSTELIGCYDDFYQPDYFYNKFINPTDINLQNEIAFIDSTIFKINSDLNNPSVNLSSLIWCKMDFFSENIMYDIFSNSKHDKLITLYFTKTSKNQFKSLKLKYYIYCQLIIESHVSKIPIRENLNNYYFGYKDSSEICNNFDITCSDGNLKYVKSKLNDELDSLFENYFNFIKQKSILTLIKEKRTPLIGSNIEFKKVYVDELFNNYYNQVQYKKGVIISSISSNYDSVWHQSGKWIDALHFSNGSNK